MKFSPYFFLLLLLMFSGCGEDGQDGEIGPSGFNALVEVTTLEVGDENCPNGGTRIDTGIDNGDGEGTAGNGELEPGEIDDTAYICNGSDGEIPDDGFRFDELSLANFGPHDYGGFESVVISDRYPDSRIEDEIRASVYVDKALDPDSISSERTLMRFNGIEQELRDIREPSEASTILAVTLYVQVDQNLFDNFNNHADIDFLEFGVFSMNTAFFPNTVDADDYSKSSVSWNEIAPGSSWDTEGLFDRDLIARWDDKQIVVNDEFSLGGTWYALRLDTARIGDWRIDSQNKGFLLSLGEQFAVLNGSDVDVTMTIDNVLLHFELEIEDLNQGGRVGGRIGGSEATIKPWEERTEAEKFTPLYRYLNGL